MTPTTNKGYLSLLHHEDSLINQRLNWLLGSQSLLFAGYAVMLTADRNKLAIPEERWLQFLQMVPWLGVLVSLLIWIGITGAVWASIKLQSIYEEKQLGISFSTTFLGWTPSLFIPLVFTVAWFFSMSLPSN